MVLGAIIQFMKRVFHLIVGLLRLSYRKVSFYIILVCCVIPGVLCVLVCCVLCKEALHDMLETLLILINDHPATVPVHSSPPPPPS